MQITLRLLLALLCSSLTTVHAQSDPPNSPSIEIEKVYKKGRENEEVQIVGINDTLILKITNLDALIQNATEKCVSKPKDSKCSNRINLYLNSKKIAERDPDKLGKEKDTIEFDLKYDSTDSGLKKNWTSLMNALSLDRAQSSQVPVQVAIGLEGNTIQHVFSDPGEKIKLRVDSPVIEKVYILGSENAENPILAINDTLVLEVTNLSVLKEKALEQCAKQPQTPNCKKKINLYLNGKKIAERHPDGLGRKEDTVEFDLRYDSTDTEQKKNWASLLGAPPFNDWEKFSQRPVQVAIGLEDGTNWYSYNDPNKKIMLEQVNKIKFFIFVGALLFIVFIIYRSQDLQKMIREALSDIGSAPASGFKPWSLARCQIAFWFVLVTVSFLSIWITTGALDTITDGVLTLVGIGAGAALGSTMIDASAGSQSKLNAEKKKIEQEILELDGKELTEEQKQHLHDLMRNLYLTDQQIAKLESAHTSQGFLKDVLNDQEGGAAFHRIQIVVWTLILGIIFIYSVWKTLSMPDFNENLLILQGLSAGTYLGFKIPEKK